MDRDGAAELQEEIRRAYTWVPGSCFRCSTSGADTAMVGTIDAGDRRFILRACERCLCELERDRERAALRASLPYAPGIRVG